MFTDLTKGNETFIINEYQFETNIRDCKLLLLLILIPALTVSWNLSLLWKCVSIRLHQPHSMQEFMTAWSQQLHDPEAGWETDADPPEPSASITCSNNNVSFPSTIWTCEHVTFTSTKQSITSIAYTHSYLHCIKGSVSCLSCCRRAGGFNYTILMARLSQDLYSTWQFQLCASANRFHIFIVPDKTSSIFLFLLSTNKHREKQWNSWELLLWAYQELPDRCLCELLHLRWTQAACRSPVVENTNIKIQTDKWAFFLPLDAVFSNIL